MKNQTGVKPYDCEKCGKAFYKGPNLSVHFKVHTEKILYMPNISKRNLSHHMKIIQNKGNKFAGSATNGKRVLPWTST